MEKLRVYLRNFFFFYIWFLWSGGINVVPQIFFLTNYSEKKVSLVAAFLILGAISSILGIEASRKGWLNKGNHIVRQKFLIFIFYISMPVTFLMLFLLQDLILYFIMFIIFRFTSNYLYNYQDQYFIKNDSESDTKIHIQSNIIYQLLGIMTAPLYFSIFYTQTVVHVVGISFAGIFAMAFPFWYIMKDRDYIPSIESKVSNIARFDKRDKLFILYSGLIISLVATFSSLTIYIVRDYYHFTNAQTIGGVLICVISFIAVISSFITSLLHESITEKTYDNKPFASKFNIIILTALIFSGILMLSLKFSLSIAYLIIFAIIAGTSYGIFLITTRNYASAMSKFFRKTNILSIYNTIPNYALLFGLSIAFIISFLASQFNLNFYIMIFVFLMIIIAFSLIIFLVSISNIRKK